MPCTFSSVHHTKKAGTIDVVEARLIAELSGGSASIEDGVADASDKPVQEVPETAREATEAEKNSAHRAAGLKLVRDGGLAFYVMARWLMQPCSVGEA